MQQGQEQFADSAFCEKEVVVGENGLFVGIQKEVEVVGELCVLLLGFSGELLDFGSQLCFLQLVVLYDRFLQLFAELVDVGLMGIAVGGVELLKMLLEGFLVALDAAHGLLEVAVAALHRLRLTSKSAR